MSIFPTVNTLPEEATYSFPPGFPQGMHVEQYKLMQAETIPGNSGNNSVGGTPAGTVININIPAMPSTFVDTDTTYLNVKFTVSSVVSLTATNGTPVANQSAACSTGGAPIYLIGSGWSLFRQYDVYANNSNLTDSVNEIGILMDKLYRVAYNSSERDVTGGPLGFTRTGVGCALGDFFNTNLGAVGCPAGTTATNGFNTGATASVTFVSQYNVVLPLPGTLGSGNKNMYPLWLGPTNIRLTTEDPANYIRYSGDAATGAYTIGTGPQATTAGSVTLQFVTINSVEFNCSLVRCAQDILSVIYESLPSPLTMISRVIGWTMSSATLTAGSNGQIDVQSTSRCTSNKMFMILFSPSLASAQTVASATGATLTTTGLMMGKYASINPNLTQGTQILINNLQFPQRSLDYETNPMDAYMQMLQTFRTALTTGFKPSIRPDDFMVCDNYWNQAYGNGAYRSPIWTAIQGNALATSAKPSTLFGASLLRARNASVLTAAPINNIGLTGGFLSGENSEVSGTFPTVAIVNTGPGYTFSDSFMMAVDTEIYPKREFVSGVSTLFAGAILRLYMKQALAYSYTIYMFAQFDGILLHNLAANTTTFTR